MSDKTNFIIQMGCLVVNIATFKPGPFSIFLVLWCLFWAVYFGIRLMKEEEGK